MIHKKIRLCETSEFEAIYSSNPWIQKLPENELRRCRQEIQDIIYHGQLLADQGANFSTRRNIDLNDINLTISASYGKPSILQKLFPWAFR